jgi:hypothetical protein
MLVGWTQGGYPSPNFQLAQHFSGGSDDKIDAVLDRLARERFGPEGGPHARKAWTITSDAFRQYPYHINVVYTCPIQWGPANLLYAMKTGYKAPMWGIPYDDLDGWRGPYPPDVFAAQFEKMAKVWQDGVTELQMAVEKTPLVRRGEAEKDLRYARAAGICFQSVANQSHFVMARDAIAKLVDAAPFGERRRLSEEVVRCLESEIELARELFAIACEDSRIGFEPSCQYFYLPLDLVEKVINCRWLMKHYKEECR